MPVACHDCDKKYPPGIWYMASCKGGHLITQRWSRVKQLGDAVLTAKDMSNSEARYETPMAAQIERVESGERVLLGVFTGYYPEADYNRSTWDCDAACTIDERDAR